MKVVVTGAAGFVGSHLCEALVARGDEVVAVDLLADPAAGPEKDANTAGFAAAVGGIRELDVVHGDLRPLVEGADVVVNEAARPGLAGGWPALDDYLSVNTVAVGRVVDACRDAGVPHLVQASTSSVYGEEAVGDEDGPTRPISPYGVSKLAAEAVLRARAGSDGPATTVLRYFSIYGPRQRPDMAYRRFCEALLAGRPIVVHGDGLQSRSNTYVGDCVAATLAAIDQPPDVPVRTCNVGGGRELALLDAAALLADLLDAELRIEWSPPRPGDQRRTVADIGRAQAELGWAPVVEPEEGLALMATWARQRFG